jgi:lycopene beta-cyclase
VQNSSDLSFYNYTIVGAGASGLWLANSMSNHGLLKNKTLCIVENDTNKVNDRTWCYWAKSPVGDQEMISKEWDLIKNLYRKNNPQIFPYKYYHVKSHDFYDHIKSSLRENPNVFWKNDSVTEVNNISEKKISIKASQESWVSDYVFLSALPTSNKTAEQQKLIHYLGKQEEEHPLFLWQSFVGYRIKTSKPVFNPLEMTMMDFNTPQGQFTQFFYELPFSENEALIEFTRFGTQVLDYEYAIKQIDDRLRVKNIDYEILEIEKGAIPMTPQFDQLKNNLPHHQNIIYIGALAGALKPSTGYGFKRMYHYAENLTQALKQTGNIALPTMKRKWRFRLYDILLLQILTDTPYLGKSIFEALFTNQPITRILKFLDEDTTIFEEILIFSRLSIVPFLKSLFKYSFTR